jgi:zinc finger-containing ubiquitin peptidase 1
VYDVNALALRPRADNTQKRELGRYAFEDHMPEKVRTVLEREDDSNKLRGVIPKLSDLLENCNAVERAYLCSENAIQVWKSRDEGGTFCGYRNIQMMMLCRTTEGAAPVSGTFRNILSIQDAIEEAWDHGHNAVCREQTQGIRNTRKYIGTLEVEALLSQLGTPHSVDGYYGREAYDQLLDSIWIYFASTPIHHNWRTAKVQCTEKAPVYLQLPGHSLTVVGIEENNDHERRMLFFDPAWAPPPAMQKEGPLPESIVDSFWRRKLLLRQYRKPNAYFWRYNAFETVMIHDKITEPDESNKSTRTASTSETY